MHTSIYVVRLSLSLNLKVSAIIEMEEYSYKGLQLISPSGATNLSIHHNQLDKNF